MRNVRLGKKYPTERHYVGSIIITSSSRTGMLHQKLYRIDSELFSSHKKSQYAVKSKYAWNTAQGLAQYKHATTMYLAPKFFYQILIYNKNVQLPYHELLVHRGITSMSS
jgi:hypothetical protein